MFETLIDRIEKVENFTLEHAPDICKEIVKHRIVTLQNKLIVSGLVLFLSIIGLTVTGVLVNMGYNAERYSEAPYYISAVIIGALSAIGAIAGFFESLENFLKLREIKVSEKLVVLKGLSDLIN